MFITMALGRRRAQGQLRGQASGFDRRRRGPGRQDHRQVNQRQRQRQMAQVCV